MPSIDSDPVDIEATREADTALHDLWVQHFAEYSPVEGRLQFPRSLDALLGFVASTNFLKNGTFDAIETDNFYASKVLLRSRIEHTLSATYIFSRVVKTNTDSAGQDYYLYCGLHDQLSMRKAMNRQVDEPVTPPRSIAGRPLREVIEGAKRFSPAAIVDYLSDTYRDQATTQSTPIKKLLPMFAELASFVHGSPLALQLSGKLTLPNARYQEYLKDAEWAFLAAREVKVLFFTLAGVTNGHFRQVADSMSSVRVAARTNR